MPTITALKMGRGKRTLVFLDGRFAFALEADVAAGLSVGADLTWNVTKLTTLKLGVGRAVHETTQQDSSGYFSTDVDVSADHELLRNLIISLAAGFGRNEYQGIDREDDRLSFSLAGKYMLNRKFYITLQYGYDGRDSNLAGSDYDKNTVMLRLRGQL